LTSILSGGTAWDIDELHNHGWLKRYQPECATEGQTPTCATSVWIQTSCHYAGSVNYSLYGVMFRLCSDFYNSLLARYGTWWDRAKPFSDYGEAQDGAESFKEKEMMKTIYAYKSDAWNMIASQAWAGAGYHGWPLGPAPRGDLADCGECTKLTYLDGRTPQRMHVNAKTGDYDHAGTGEFSVHWRFKRWKAANESFNQWYWGPKKLPIDKDEWLGGPDEGEHAHDWLNPEDFGFHKPI
jgi:hypothetical protein